MEKIPVEKKSSSSWIWWLLLILGILALVWWLFSSDDDEAEYVVNDTGTIMAESQDDSETLEPMEPR